MFSIACDFNNLRRAPERGISTTLVRGRAVSLVEQKLSSLHARTHCLGVSEPGVIRDSAESAQGLPAHYAPVIPCSPVIVTMRSTGAERTSFFLPERE